MPYFNNERRESKELRFEQRLHGDGREILGIPFESLKVQLPMLCTQAREIFIEACAYNTPVLA